MTTPDAPKDADSESVKVFAELKNAGIIRVGLLAMAAVAIYVGILFSLRGDSGFSELAEFGDSFGALTSVFNALAFAAVVVTVVLQSKELRESRQELVKQAEAQKAWADAATKQIEVTERLERLKIRPILSLVWNDRVRTNAEGFSTYKAYLVIRNVGLGAAFIDEIGTEFGGTTAFSYESADEPNIGDRWGAALQRSGVGHDMYTDLVVGKLRNRHRALAAGSQFQVVEIRFPDKTRFQASKRVIQANLNVYALFRSLDDEAFDTRTQSIARRSDSVGDDAAVLPCT